MDKETYFKNQRVFFLYSATITCIIIGLFLHYGKLVLISDKITKAVSFLFIVASYFLFLRIAARLKKKDIHGLSAIAWAALLLFIFGEANVEGYNTGWSVLNVLLTVLFVFSLVDGVIRFVVSLIMTVKKAANTEEKTVESIDTTIAILTSLVAIIISIIEMF